MAGSTGSWGCMPLQHWVSPCTSSAYTNPPPQQMEGSLSTLKQRQNIKLQAYAKPHLLKPWPCTTALDICFRRSLVGRQAGPAGVSHC